MASRQHLHALRPCLRHDELASSGPSPFPFAAYPVPATHVHFPPTPNLTSYHLTHDRHTYDRAPITVGPNLCALPNRNERIYTPDTDRPRKRRLTPGPSPSSSTSSPQVKGSYFHPRAFEAFQYEPTNPPYPHTLSHTLPPASAPIPVPGLVPDASSESDESDVILTPPGPSPPPSFSPSSKHSSSRSSSDHRARFLPHAPDPEQERERERGRKTSPSASRRSSGRAGGQHGQRSSVHRSEFAAPELDGCLGGF